MLDFQFIDEHQSYQGGFVLPFILEANVLRNELYWNGI